MKGSNLKKIIAGEKATLGQIVKTINKTGVSIVLVCGRGNRLKGVITEGDARRVIHQGHNLSENISSLYNREPQAGMAGDDTGKIKKLLLSKKSELGGSIQVPIVDAHRRVVDLAYLDQGSVKFLSKARISNQNGIREVLVTGGAGYLGSVLVRQLLAEGYRVKVLDNLTFGKTPLVGIWANRNFDLVVGDILNIADVVEAIKDVDAVVHLAAIVGDAASSYDPVKTINNNILATANIANACRKFLVKRLVYASSCSVYGASESLKLLTERSDLAPVSLYANSKIESEIELKKLADDTFAPTILRFATLFGHSWRPRFDLVVNLFCAQAFYKKRIRVFDGSQWRPFLHTTDAARAIITVLQSPLSKVGGETFNVGAGELNLTIDEVARKVAKLVGHVSVETLSEKGDIRNYKVSFEKIRRVLGFKTKVKIEDGIMEILKELKKIHVGSVSRMANIPLSKSNFAAE